MADEDKRRDEAAEWFAALRTGPMLVEKRQAFDLWRADPLNQRALDAMHELWGELSMLKHARPPAAPVAPARRRSLRGAGLAVALMIIGGASLALFRYVEASDTTIRTAIGQQRSQSLPDGSVLAVNVASRVSYKVDVDTRLVTIDEGEAAFTVRGDQHLPFRVRTGDYEMRATGTAFNVRKRDGVIEVAVSEGVVEICAGAGPNAGDVLRTLAAGELARMSSSREGATHETVIVSPISPSQVAEWRMRVVTYENTPLLDVIADFNRFFEQKLIVLEPRLGMRRVTLRLQVDDRQRAIATLASMLNVRVRETPEQAILIE
jgi:transmembrane sensor